MKITITCDYCGKTVERTPAQLKGRKHYFCCRQCLADYSNKTKNPESYMDLKDYANMSLHMSLLNSQLNPERMTAETREKLRNAKLGRGEGKTYAKLYGRHEHRIVAEQILGRPLREGEVVHHMDGNKRNNSPDNLKIFSSQAEHAAFHADLRRGYKVEERQGDGE